MAFKNDSPGWIRIAYVSMAGVIYWNINNFQVSTQLQLKKRPRPQQPLTSKSSPAGSLALLLNSKCIH